MKKSIHLLLMILFSNLMFSQTLQDLGLANVNNGYSMVKVGNFIYYTNSNPVNSYFVYKFDTTSPNPVSTQVSSYDSGFVFLTGIAHHNGFLYVAANNCIWKIDLAITNAPPQVYYYKPTSDTQNIFALHVIGNDLYFNSRTGTSSFSSNIYKVNLLNSAPTSSTPVITAIPNGIGSMVNVGNTMFISTIGTGSGVKKFDLTNPSAGLTTVITESGYICRMMYYKNRIFYPNETSNQVKSFDPNEAAPTPNFEFTYTRVAGLLGVDCDIYAANTTSSSTNRLVKIKYPYVSGNSTQTINVTSPSDATIEDLVVNGSNIVWFNSSADAIANVNPIAPNTQLISGNTYYAISTVDVCRSVPFAVSTTVLGNETFLKSKMKVYPNPTKDNISIDFDTIYEKIDISVTNAIGQEIQFSTFESMNTISIEMPKSEGLYFVTIKTNEGKVTYKIIKE